MEILERFLADWKQRAFDYYMGVIKRGIEIEKEHQRWCEERKAEARAAGEYWFDAKGLDHWRDTVRNFWRENRFAKDIRDYGSKMTERLDKELDREVTNKRKSLITRVEKKAGKIIDANGLSLGANGEINGFVIGEKGKVKVQTIYAGGYKHPAAPLPGIGEMRGRDSPEHRGTRRKGLAVSFSRKKLRKNLRKSMKNS
jgi:hypothetical protein